MITDDELAVLIMRACSSRNLFVKHHVVTCESVARRSYFTNKSFRAVCARSLICVFNVCACVYESSEASAYSFGLATNPNPTRARSYPLNINPKPSRPLILPHTELVQVRTFELHVAGVYLCVCMLHCVRLWYGNM